ncbi:MAG: site-2 protease family protein [Planctomycetota bacterium]|jgi:tetratricopeptide (TPR) repeat protein
MARTCTRCGARSETDDAFVVRRRSFSRETLTLCPRCVGESDVRQRGAAVVLILVLAGIAAVLGMATETLAGVNFVLMIAFMFAVVPIHECAHALAAKLLGLRLFRVVLGCGRLLLGFRLGVPVEVRAIPLSGLTVVGHRTRRFLRLRAFLVALAGPLSNVAMLWLAFAFVPPGEIIGCFDDRVMPVGAFAIANALVLFENLLPLKARTSLGSIPRDGLVMLAAPFMGQKQVDEALLVRYTLETTTAYESHGQAAAPGWSGEVSAKVPDVPVLQHDIAVAHFRQGDFAGARHLLLDLLGTPGLCPGLRALAHSNIAASDVRLGDPELLGEAEQLSRDAFRAAPGVPVIKGTRGSVLVETGSLDEGLSLLRQAIELSEDAEMSAIFACWVAIGEGRRGNRDEALRYLARARELDASCSALSRAERDVEATSQKARR